MVLQEPWQQVVVINFFHCILSLCLVPVHGDELASIPTGVRPYAGLSFKSGYQQTGYVHPILSYGDVKYYYCLKLEARCLELGQVRLRTFVLFPRRYLCFYLTMVLLPSEVWFLEALQPHSFISVSAYNFSADQPAT